MKTGPLSLHALYRILFSLLLALACLPGAKAQCPASSPLVINSVTPAESRCQATGSATVSVSGGSTPYTYSITLGPTLVPPQSSNVLQSLAPGTYTVQVTDNCNTSVTSSFTVAGTYTIPTPTFTTQAPSCGSSSDGSLTVSVPNGRAPLTYSLISPSPVTVGPQSSNVFTGLPAGNYTCQVTDSCGNFQTRPVTVPAGNSGSIINVVSSSSFQYNSCDNWTFPVTIGGDYKPPFTVSLTLPNGTVMTHVLTSSTTDAFTFTYHHITGNADPVTITLSNNCGASFSSTLDMSNYLDMSSSVSTPSGCDTSYVFTFDNNYDNSSFLSPYRCASQTYTLISPSGAVLATQTNNSTFSGFPPGNGYKVIRQGCCLPDTLTFDWPAFTPVSVNFYFSEPFGACKDGTTSLWIYLKNVATSTGQITIVSGPPSVTFADGTVHTYTYPDVIPAFFGSGQTSISGFTAGTYKAFISDACGYGDSTEFTVYPSDLRYDAFTATPVKGCPGTSQINLNASTNAGNVFQIASINVNSSTVANIVNSPYSGSVSGLSPGIYGVSYNTQVGSYNNGWLNGMDSYSCDVITDTVTVSAYTQPAFASTPAIANCGTTSDVALLPDNTSGVQPYQFQIIGGPITTSAQASPVFSGLSTGTYTFQMVDACGNSYSHSMTIDTLIVPNVSTIGGACAGGSATFFLPSSPFFNYSWQHPDGTTTTGDTLSYNPITSADTGTYKILLTSTIGGCTSTTSKNFILGYCTVLAEDLLNFSGTQTEGNIRLSWTTTDEPSNGDFIVGRSTDGVTFYPIQQLDAHTFTTIDTHVPPGMVYYRLQIVGNDGTISYSNIISFNKDNKQLVNVYPRWITGNTPVKCTYPVSNGNAFFRVVDVDGKTWRTVPLAKGTTQTTIDVGSLPGGNYFIVYTTENNVVPTQVFKE